MKRILTLILVISISLTSLFASGGIKVEHAKNETITAISSDIDGNILYSSLRGLFRFDGTNIKNLSPNNNVIDFILHDDGSIFFVTSNQLCRLDENLNLTSCKKLYFLSLKILDVDSKNIAVVNKMGVFVLDKNTLEEVYRYPLTLGECTSAVSDQKTSRLFFSEGKTIHVFSDKLSFQGDVSLDYRINDIELNYSGDRILIATTGGLFSMNPVTLSVSRESSLSGKNIVSLMKDSKNGIVVLSDDGTLTDLEGDSFINTKLDVGQSGMESCVGYIYKDEFVFLSPDKFSLEYYDIRKPRKTTALEYILAHHRVNNICETSDGLIWTLSDGSLYKYDKASDKAEIVNLPQLSYLDNILVCSNEDFIIYSPGKIGIYSETDGVLSLKKELPCSDYIFKMVENIDGIVMMISPNGTYLYDEENGLRLSSSATVPDYVNKKMGVAVDFKDDGSIDIHQNGTVTNQVVGDGKSNVKLMYITKDNTVWFVNTGNIVYCFDIKSYELLHKYQIEVNNSENYDIDVYSFEVSGEGELWLGSSNGLVQITKDGKPHYYNTGRTFDYYTSSLRTSDGTMLFAYSNGITVFDENDLSTLYGNNSLNLNIWAVNVNDTYYGRFGSLGSNIKPLELKYFQNNISIESSVIDFDRRNLIFMYRLKGYEDEWKSTEDHIISYSNLPKGKYEFQIKLSGAEDSKIRQFSIDIAPAPWNTLAARILYALLWIAAIYGIIWYYRRRAEKNRKLLQEEMDKMKIDFFTNISHEFRTPLSLVSAPLGDIRRSGELSKDNLFRLELAERSVTKMMNLTEQLLDYNNVNKDYSVIHLSKTDVVKQMRNMVQTFGYSAAGCGVKLSLSGLSSCLCQVDQVKVGRIMSNLLSNAIKYSPDGGNVDVNISVVDRNPSIETLYGLTSGDSDTQYLEIKVSDEGIGIDKSKREAIFERYHRGGIDKILSSVGGFGIGLNYTRQLVEAHGGKIIAESNYPKGSVFRFVIPLSEYIDAVSEVVVPEMDDEELHDVVIDESLGGFAEETESEKAIVLFVDDEEDMRTYVPSVLRQKYEVIVAKDGQEALEVINSKYVDIVVSDVMMPRLGGYELCRKLRENPVTCSLPVILLTAKTDTRSHVHGIKSGADAYLSKPFDSELLLANVETILSNRRKIQHLVQETTSDTP